MQLYDHQRKILERNPAKHLLCWDTGTGKTVAMLALSYENAGLDGRILVVCPKSLVKKWQRDSATFLSGFPAAKLKSLKEGTAIVRKPKVVSKEEFRRDWQKYSKPDVVIIDEGHHFAGVRSKGRSQLFETMMRFLRKWNVPYVYMGTATAYLSSPWNIYAIAMILGYVWSRIKFEKRFFVERYIGRTDKRVAGERRARAILVPKDGIKEEIATIVNKIGSTIRLDECADVPEQVFIREYFEPTQDQLDAIEEMRSVEQNPAVRYGREHSILNGVLKGDEYTPTRYFESNKTEWILDKSDEHKKMAVICRYTAQIEHLRELLEEKGKTVYTIQGGVDADAVVLAVEAAEECVVIIQAQISEGYELPSIDLWVFASLAISYKDYKQMLGRPLRINALKKNVYVHLIVEGGVDEAWHTSIMNKQDFNIEIYSEKYRTIEERPTFPLYDETGSEISNQIQPLA